MVIQESGMQLHAYRRVYRNYHTIFPMGINHHEEDGSKPNMVK